MQKTIVVVASLLLVNVLGQTIDCNLRTGLGCRNTGPFRFTEIDRRQEIWNSLCSKQYQMTIDPLNRFGGGGYQCTLQMDVPEQNAFIYSFAEDRLATFKTSSTPFIYGFGLNARVASKAVSRTSSAYLDWALTKAHTEPDNNHFSWVSYRVENNQLSVFSSQGLTLHTGSTALYSPTFRSTYVGLNRLYATSSGQGSGVCRIRCSILPQRAFNGQPGARGQPGPGQPGAAGPPGSPGQNSAPGQPGAAGQPGSQGQPGAAGQPGSRFPSPAPGQQPGFDGQPGQQSQSGQPGQSGQPIPPTISPLATSNVAEPGIERFVI